MAKKRAPIVRTSPVAPVDLACTFEHISHHKKRSFLVAFAASGSVIEAAAAADVDRRSHYVWKHGDPEYAEAFAKATEQAGDMLEAELLRRARGFTPEQGKVYSDTLLIFALKGWKPEKYRESRTFAVAAGVAAKSDGKGGYTMEQVMQVVMAEGGGE